MARFAVDVSRQIVATTRLDIQANSEEEAEDRAHQLLLQSEEKLQTWHWTEGTPIYNVLGAYKVEKRSA